MPISENDREIRAELQKAIDQDHPDSDRVLELLGKLETDSETVRFSTDATIVNRLGQELVSKQQTALAEIVKNAYDADATEVHLRLIDAHAPGGTLEVSDNGLGMTKDEVIRGFMTLSGGLKRSNPFSKKYGRKRAGEKGIGRFAAHRLGRKLVLVSRSEEEPCGYRVEIDWDQFTSGKDVRSIANSIQEVETEEPGTLLRIELLRDSWTDAKVKQVWRHLATLQTPFPVHGTSPDSKVDPGFNVCFYRGQSPLEEQKPLIDSSHYFSYALAEIVITIDPEGFASWMLKSERYGDRGWQDIGPTSNEKGALRFASNVEARAFYFIRSSALYPHGVWSALQPVLRNQGGIRLYRNGYRVLPYGEPGDDWLNLDFISQSRTGVLAPVGNRNFLGFINVDDQEGIRFQETAAREGLIENEAFHELTDVVTRSLLDAVRHIDNARSVEKDQERERRRSKRSETSKLAKSARETIVSNTSSDKQGEVTKALDTIETAWRSEFNERVSELSDENAMLRIVASMGLTIAEFVHEYGFRAAAMRGDLRTVLDAIPENSGVLEAASRLQMHFGDVEGFGKYFASTLQQNASRVNQPIELSSFTKTFVEKMRVLFGDRVKSIEVLEPEDPMFTTPMHASEWSSILMNFMTNSRKAIEQASVEEGKILIEVSSDGNSIVLTFSDNGIGIPEENWDRVFEAFFSTTSSASARAPDEEALVGTGLGLKIVRDIVSGVNGSADVVMPPEGFNTCLRVAVPRATDKQIDEIYED